MSEDGIREWHGTSCRVGDTHKPGNITIAEGDDRVWLFGDCNNRSMTEWQARYLAAKLYRLARRIRARREASEAAA